MLNTDEMSKLYQLNRDLDNAKYKLELKLKEEKGYLQSLIIEKTVERILKINAKSNVSPKYAAMSRLEISIAIREAIQESVNVSDY